MDKIVKAFCEKLGIKENATLEEIKSAYKNIIMKYDPNINLDLNHETYHKIICEINEAYRIIREVYIRQVIDETLSLESKNSKPIQDEIIDFDMEKQKNFILWLELFSSYYQEFAYNYYKKLNDDKESNLEKIYLSFEYVIDGEKEILKEKSLNS